MTPYYKLPPQWATSQQQFVIIGPDGLVSHKLCSEIQKAYAKHQVKRLSVLDTDDIANLKNTLLSGCLFSEPEILFIRLNEKLISKFPWDIPPSQDKIIVIHGIEKAPKSNPFKTFGLVIRTYLMKEPFLSKEITALLLKEKVSLSKRGIKWLALSHSGSENMIIPTIQRLQLTFGKQSIPDNNLKSAIYNLSEVTAFDVIDALIDNQTKLHLFVQSQKKEDWPKVYWALLSYWRKILLSSIDKTTISTHFPWDSQKKQALKVIGHIPQDTLLKTHKDLLALEQPFKGMSNELPIPLLKSWLYQTQTLIHN